MELVVLLLVLVLVAIMWAAINTEITSHKQRIAKHLIKAGASDVVVSYVWSSVDRSNRDYKVEYTDPLGRHRQITCKINGWTGKIYWSTPPRI